jgi:hypothetical protein
LNLWFGEGSFHVFEAGEIKRVNVDRVILELYSQSMNYEHHLIVVVKVVVTYLVPMLLFWCYLHSFVIVEKLLKERVKTDFLQLFGQCLLVEDAVLAQFALTLQLYWLLL